MNHLSVEDCQKITVQNIKDSLNDGAELDINGTLVRLISTRCNYGGNRYWFVCPSCSNRVGVLYRKPLNQVFICRKCNDLTYQTVKYRRSKLEPLIRSLKPHLAFFGSP